VKRAAVAGSTLILDGSFPRVVCLLGDPDGVAVLDLGGGAAGDKQVDKELLPLLCVEIAPQAR
jgi:hypothetical protein